MTEEFVYLRKLAPFMRKARVLEIGRERLLQVRHKLALVLITEDISENSRAFVLSRFSCPVFQCLRSEDLFSLFGYQGTRMLGFRRSPLLAKILPELHSYRINAPEEPPAEMPAQPRVAVLGASGIGRHHANWWQMEGASVCAVLGRTPESLVATRLKLQELFPFAGALHSDLAELLAGEKPDIVDVCLPPALHYQAVKASLQAGCHVLCEKPFLYDPALSHAELLAQAREVADLAAARGLLLGMASQYTVMAHACLDWCRQQGLPTPRRLLARLVSAGHASDRTPRAVWVDLAPHLLGVVRATVPGAEIDWASLQVDFHGSQASAEFVCRRPHGQVPLECRIETAFADVPPLNVRRLQFDDAVFDLQGVRGADGVYQASVTTPAGNFECPDMLRLLIRLFGQGVAAVPRGAAVQNLDWLLTCLDRAGQTMAEPV